MTENCSPHGIYWWFRASKFFKKTLARKQASDIFSAPFRSEDRPLLRYSATILPGKWTACLQTDN
jgi:hypothetical protein